MIFLEYVGSRACLSAVNVKAFRKFSAGRFSFLLYFSFT